MHHDDTDVELARRELTGSPLYVNRLMSADGGTTALQVNLERDEAVEALRARRDELREKQLAGELSAIDARELETVVAEFDRRRDALIEQEQAVIAAVRAVLDDPGVDVGVVGCVPLTPALATLAEGPGHDEDVTAHDSVAARLVRLHAESTKPWVAVVDAGPLYDPMAAMLERNGVPTFRSADRALRLLATFCRARR